MILSMLILNFIEGAVNTVSDHYLFEGRLKFIKRWRHGRGLVEVQKAVKINELIKERRIWILKRL